jgi:hypothetical protein
MLMKKILALSFWLALMTCVPTGVALAQDSTRVPEVSADPNASVDATAHAEVHAGTDEQSNQQPQTPRQTNNRQPKGATKWTFQPSDQPPSTRFQPAQPAKPNPAGQTERNDSMTLFNPLTRSETPPDEEPTADKNQSQKISPAGTNQPHGNKQPPDTQSAARLKLLDSLNNNVPPPTSKTWNSPVNSYAHKSTSSTATSPAAISRKKPKPTAQPPLQDSLSRPSDSKSSSLKSNPQKRKPLDPTLHDKLGSSRDSQSSPN